MSTSTPATDETTSSSSAPPPPTVSPRTPPFRSSFFSWVPTDEKQLYDCESVLLGPLYKIGFTQYHCAGLNTVSLKPVFVTKSNNNTQKDQRESSSSIFDLSHLKQQQNQIFNERYERANSFFGGSSASANKQSCAAKKAQPLNMKEEEHEQNPAPTSISTTTTTSSLPELQIPIHLHHIVFVHGFAGGIVNWLPNLKNLGDLVNKKNFNALQKAYGKAEREYFSSLNKNEDDNNDAQRSTSASSPVNLTILHAFDLPGFARSKRDESISFSSPEGVIRYMTWSFNEWFKENEISASSSNVEKWIRRAEVLDSTEKFKVKFVSTSSSATPHNITLNGHSFGAFLSAHYCSNYPSPTSKQFADSQKPDIATATTSSDSSSSSASASSCGKKPLQPKSGCGVSHLILTDPFGVGIFDEKNPAHTTANFDWKWRTLAGFMIGTMESALTPALRALGPFAPNVINNMRPDFLDRWKDLVEDPKMIMDYIFHCNAQKANLGDHSMAKTVIKGSRAYAHIPLLPFVPKTEKLDAQVKVSMVYGNNSWMDKQAGRQMFDERRDNCKKVASSPMGLFEVIENAGHQVNTDQPEVYDDFLIRTCELR